MIKKIFCLLTSLFLFCGIVSAEQYTRVHAKHILVKTAAEAQQIKHEIDNGGSFEYYARVYSLCPSGRQGGDLGYFSKGDMDENFEKAVFSLENKEIYPKVVETSYGYHIIKKTGEKYVDFDDEKDSLMETLSNNKQNTLLQDALEKYNVKINI